MARDDDEATGRHVSLVALRGATDRPAQVTAVWPGGSEQKELWPGRALMIGRSRACDVCIPHPSVSREHAVLYGSRPATVEDRGSTNGTTVAGVRVATAVPVTIRRGQVVAIGAAVLVVQEAFEETPALDLKTEGDEVVVADERMRELYRIVDLVAKGELAVILLGEPGAGKDVVADAIHRRSARGTAPCGVLGCAGSAPLLERELFGYERGAFPGALQAKPGLLEIAEGGTIVLDEIAELAPAMQVKLLRVLESREAMRLGGFSPRPVDVRFVCATRVDLGARVRAGTFRQDLYFRLNGITLVIPPLRRRRAEIGPLASAFADRAARAAGRGRIAVTKAARAVLESCEWPGNVRELRSAIERAVGLSGGDAIDVHHLPSMEGEPEPPIPALGLYDAARSVVQSIERRRIADAIEKCGGNQTRAAELLRISRRTLVARLTEYGFARPLKKGGNARGAS